MSFLHSSACFYGAAPKPYTDVAISNLYHPYLRSTAILFDTCLCVLIHLMQRSSI